MYVCLQYVKETCTCPNTFAEVENDVISNFLEDSKFRNAHVHANKILTRREHMYTLCTVIKIEKQIPSTIAVDAQKNDIVVITDNA